MKLSDIEGVAEAPTTISQSADIVDLSEFLATTGALTEPERREIIDQAQFLMEEIYVHLPLKRAMHAVDPVQRLKLLRRKVGILNERQFHDEMISIFKSVRDLHTNYILPAPYRGHTAFLPFLMEEFYDASRARHYIVSRMLVGFSHPTFVPGVEITHWSGVPVERAVEDNADLEAGSNPPARYVRGLDGMTVRPMAMSLPPAAEWILVGYVSLDGISRELRLPWQVFSPNDTGGGTGQGMASEDDSSLNLSLAMGLDLNMELTNRARQELFVENTQNRRDTAQKIYRGGTQGDARLEAIAAETSFFPDTFEFRTVAHNGTDFGYLRIRTFSQPGPSTFIDEVRRILGMLPQNGLIIDVRGNGGGIILNGERMLQLFTDDTIEAERLQFINNDITHRIAEAALDGFAVQWARSIELSVVTAAVYSQGFPIEPAANTNAIGRVYPGKTAVITDARCYSTTDIFAAGYQDHDIGPILGVDGNTGAGGANVFDHELLRDALSVTSHPLSQLPGGADMRFAIRRTTRVRENAGVPLEDLGVVPDHQHRMTRNDVLNDNVDLIRKAAALIS